MKRRLLVISFHYPPDGSIGGQRWAGLSKYLARAGWEVHVVTASAPRDYQMPSGVHRHFRPRRRTLNEWYRARNSERIAPTSSSEALVSDSAPGKPSRITRALILARRIAGSAAGLPDQGRGWIIRAAGAALSLMQTGEFDCVVSSGPPHSAHFAALVATLGRGTDFWIDMRDPWSATHEMNSVADRFVRAERYVLHKLERMVFPRASRVLVNTNEFAAQLRAAQPDLNVLHFPNGVDTELLPPRDISAVIPGSIAYVGTLYAGRDLSSVFTALRAVANETGGTNRPLTLNVAGPLESPHRERMLSQIQSAGLNEAVKVIGVLPRDAALELLSRSHLALVLAQDQPMCVPAKLYESVGLGIPTLVIAEKDSAAAREARRIGAFTADGHDVDGIKTLLADLMNGNIPMKIEAATPISYEALAVRMDQLLRGASALQTELAPAANSLPNPA
jgi:glycosyltransferase involved in cell wall biosynthesis